MANSRRSNMGAYIKLVLGLAPLDNAAGTRNGPAIDTRGYGSLTLVGAVGAASGTPTAQSVTYSLETSANGTTGWTAVTGGAATALAADNGLAEVDVDCSQCQRYVRAVEVTAFTGGTSPKIEGTAIVVLGGSNSLPV